MADTEPKKIRDSEAPALLPGVNKQPAVIPIPISIQETSDQEEIIQLGGFSLKSFLSPTLPELNSIEKKALESVRKLLPLVAGKDGILNVNDIPELVLALLRDPEVLREIQTGIATEVANTKDKIHSKQPLKAVEKFPIFGKGVRSVVDKAINDHVAKNEGTYNQQGIAVAKAKIEDQLSLLFRVHGGMPKSLEPDTSSRAGVTKAMIEEFGASLKILYNYELRNRQSFAAFGTTLQDERFGEGISLKNFAALNNGKPTVSEYSNKDKEEMRAFKVGHVPLESTFRYATDNDLCGFGISDCLGSRKKHLLYYDQSKGYLIRKEKGAKSGDLSALEIRLVDGNWGKFQDQTNYKMYLAEAELLDLRHSGEVKTKLIAVDPKANPDPTSFEGKQRAANLEVKERYDTWVNSRVAKIEKKDFAKLGIAEDVCNQNFDFYSSGDEKTGGPKVVAVNKKDGNFYVQRINDACYPGQGIKIFDAVKVGGETGPFSVALYPSEIGLIQKLRAEQQK